MISRLRGEVAVTLGEKAETATVARTSGCDSA